jgi:RND family efflux transporter MFP subunit
MNSLLKPSLAVILPLLWIPIAWSQSNQSVYEGFTEPRFDIMVAATEIGRLEEVLVEPGDRVEQGQTIARLEDSLQASSVKTARLQARMRGDSDGARAEVMLHQTRFDHIRELAAEQVARPNELLRAEADLKIAEARLTTAIEQHELRQLELERYELQLARRLVVAPMTGVISKIFHQPGEYITPGDPAVVRLLVLDQLYAVFNVPAEDLEVMQPGTEVRVFLRSRRKTIPGKISSIAPDIDGESGTVRVKVALDNANGNLRAGDRCTMQLGKNPEVAQRPADNTNIIYHTR